MPEQIPPPPVVDVSLTKSPIPPHDSPTSIDDDYENAFAAAVVEKITREGRKWVVVANAVGLSDSTLRSQVGNPARLKLRTARRLATVLDIPLWGQAAA